MTLHVTAAIIRDADGRYLITRRRHGTHLAGLWEFPGGKCEPGETLEGCLQRELGEELGASFLVGDHVDTIGWEYPEGRVVLHFFHCRLAAGSIGAREGQEMAWVTPARLTDYDFPPADRALVARLANAAREIA